jgi:hypothetical protein
VRADRLRRRDKRVVDDWRRECLLLPAPNRLQRLLDCRALPGNSNRNIAELSLRFRRHSARGWLISYLDRLADDYVV